MLTTLLLTLAFTVGGVPPEGADGNEVFEYYLGEFLTHELELSHPMAQLIANRLAESVFNTSKQDVFLSRIQKLREEIKKNPDRFERLVDLDHRLTKAF